MNSALVVLALSLFGAAAAGPISSCHPNFMGVPMAIINGGSKWGLASPPNQVGSPVLSLSQDRVPEFLFEFSGRPSGSYVVRAINYQGENLVVTETGVSTLDLSTENVSNTSEFWRVDCTTCGTDPSSSSGIYASGCTIWPEDPAAGVCVQLPPAEGQALNVGACGPISEQLFDFWTPL